MAFTDITLSYFPLAGRALAARLAFIYGGVQFKDNRIGDGSHKTLSPTGQLPLLTFKKDGKEYTFTQSQAIADFAASFAPELVPTDPLHRIQETEISGLIGDILTSIPPRDLANYAEVAPQRVEKINKLLGMIDQKIASYNDACSEYSKVSMVDINILSFINLFATAPFFDRNVISTGIAKPYTHIQAVCKKVIEHPKFATYFAQHPTEAIYVA